MKLLYNSRYTYSGKMQTMKLIYNYRYTYSGKMQTMKLIYTYRYTYSGEFNSTVWTKTSDAWFCHSLR